MKKLTILCLLLTILACEQEWATTGRKTVASLDGNWKTLSIVEYPEKSALNGLLPTTMSVKFSPCKNVYTKDGCQASIKINDKLPIEVTYIAGVAYKDTPGLQFIKYSQPQLSKADSLFLSGWLLKVVEDKKMTIEQRFSVPYYIILPKNWTTN